MFIWRNTSDKAKVWKIKAPQTISRTRFEAIESDSVDEHLPLFHARVHKQCGVTFAAHLKQPTPQKAILHLAFCLIEGGPGHHHRTWHVCGGGKKKKAQLLE